MSLKKAAGWSGIALALIYVTAFVFFGAWWAFPSDGTVAQKLAYLAEHQTPFTLIHVLMYIVFGVVLSVLVVGLHEGIRARGSQAIAVGSLFGAIWVGLVIASGMIATIGLAYVLDLGQTDAPAAWQTWRIVSLLTESLGGGNELAGGLWVLVVSLSALATGFLGRAVHVAGVFVGVAGVATVLPYAPLTAVFGLSQIVWFVWIGVALLRDQSAL